MRRLSGKVVLVILSILLFIYPTSVFLKNTGEAEEMKETTLKINKRDFII